MRLPNGYGSVYKLSGKRRRPYAAIVTTNWTDEGKPIRKYLGYYKTKAEAFSALTEYNDNPYSITDAGITVQAMWSKYVAYRESRKKPVSANYKSAFKRMVPFYDKPFRELTGPQIQSVIDSTADKPSLAKLVKVVMGNLYKYANLMGLTSENCAAVVDTPEIPISTKHKPFTDPEIDQLWEHASEIPSQIALLLCYTGMRPTELAHIRIDNVHLDERYMIGGIKTKAGKNRRIPIHKKILPIVKQWYDPGHTYLMTYESRHLATANALRTIWKESTLSALLNHTMHDGRHNCETRLDNAGVNKRIIQLIIGHAGDIDSVYTAKTTDQLVEAIDSIY